MKTRSRRASWPKWDLMTDGREDMASIDVMSSSWTRASEPRVCWVEGMLVGLRPVTMTDEPFEMRSWAVARPIPWVPPMMRDLLPEI